MTFAEFVHRRAGGIRWMLSQLTQNLDAAEDLCQDVLLKCSDYFRDYGSPPPFRFVKRVAQRKYYSWRRKRIPERLPDGLGFDELSREESPISDCEEEERAAAVWSAVDTLSPLDQDLIRLRYVVGWRVRKIAEEKRLGVGAVKSRIHRARSLLKRKLKKLNPI